MRSASLAGVLGTWVTGDGPLYRRLAAALTRSIERGQLAAGERLPPERSLAKALAVSRTTVVKAFGLLREGGLVESRQGSATTVRGAAASGRWNRSSSEQMTTLFGRGGRRDAAREHDPIDLSLAPTAPLPMVEEELRALVDVDLSALTARPGYSPAGLGALRRAVAERLVAAGVPTTAEEVIVTTGAQQAFSLLAALYLRPRDLVAVEEPTHPGALDVFRAAGVELHAIPTDDDGLRVDLLEKLAAARPPRLVYVIPTFSTPAGTVLSVERRHRLARLAARYLIPVVEDAAPADLALDAIAALPPVAHFGTEGPVLLVGSMSKLFWPGLRVGWVRAPRPVIAQLVRLKATADLGTPLLDQMLATRLLARWKEAQVARRAQYRPGRDHLTAALAAVLPSWRWRVPGGGFTLWVQLPHGDARPFAAVAARQGVTVAPGPLFSANEEQTDRLLLEYTLEPRILDEAVDRLARAWATYEATLEVT
jgi:DNA-binding transcriptional MocR family regulator